MKNSYYLEQNSKMTVEEAWEKWWEAVSIDGETTKDHARGYFDLAFTAGAEWQKQQMMAEIENLRTEIQDGNEWIRQLKEALKWALDKAGMDHYTNEDSEKIDDYRKKFGLE